MRIFREKLRSALTVLNEYGLLTVLAFHRKLHYSTEPSAQVWVT
jgi:hypothetical protein